jgi:hypothetical protein
VRYQWLDSGVEPRIAPVMTGHRSWLLRVGGVCVDPTLLEILACPDTHHAPLDYDESKQTLTCTECRRVFPIRDGLPVLLLDEAVPADDTQPPGRSER